MLNPALPWLATLLLATAPAEPTVPTAPRTPSAAEPTVSAPSAAAPPAPAAPSKVEVSKADAKPDAKAKTAPAAKKDEAKDEDPEAGVPPSLSKQALCSEVSRSAREQQTQRTKLAEERKALAAERAHLETLAADIAKSRDALRQETARLEDLMAHRPSTSGAPLAGASVKASGGDLDALARTFKTMGPEQVAMLLTKMDRTLSAQLLRRMRPADAGAVIEKLKPDLAADLVAQMASLPVEKAKKK